MQNYEKMGKKNLYLVMTEGIWPVRSLPMASWRGGQTDHGPS